VRRTGATRAAAGGVRRHKVQAVVIGLVLLISTASATLGLALLAASHSPFDHAFAAQRGAHVSVAVNTAGVGASQLEATATSPGVTAAAGPFPLASAQMQQGGQPFGLMTLAGRSSPGGPVDDVVLTSGRWAERPGEVVLDGTPGPGPFGLGKVFTVSGVPGSPTLTVVGFANSITNTADGWVVPSEVTKLQAPGVPASAQMLYRFASAATYAQIRADVATVSKALPDGAVAGAASWLTAQSASTNNGAIMEPFVVAFALIGVGMAVLIVANVVGGAVVAGYRRIGILKSVGAAPRQVVAAYLARVGWPALAGCLAGVLAGNVLAMPVLSKSAEAYSVGSQTVPLWADIAAPAGLFVIVIVAALGPALRAGRLSAAAAIAAGQAPRSGKGYAAHRVAARLRLPRALTLGLVAPFARPARTAVTVAAITFGATAVIFAIGLNTSLSRAAESQRHTATVQAQVQYVGTPSQQNAPGPLPPPTAASVAAVQTAIREQPGTLHYVGEWGKETIVSGVGAHVQSVAYDGDASWIGFGIISGRWYSGAGEADVNTAFLTQSGLHIGDSVTVNTGTRQATVRIVGEVFRPSSEPALFTSTQSLGGAAAGLHLEQYDVGLRPGTSTQSWAQAVNYTLGTSSVWAATGPDQGGNFYKIASDLIGLLALMVAAGAGLGVLNTVLMGTRDRMHDLGVFKAIGMRPRQVITMVVCWVVGPALVASAIAVPAAMALHSATLNAMANTAHTGIPASFGDVFSPGDLALLACAGLVIAAAGALLPATWAARSRTAVALRTE
jgi:putative ABC transport system permease protein